MATAMLAGRRCSSLHRTLLTTTTTTILRRHHLIPFSSAAAPLSINSPIYRQSQQHNLLLIPSSSAAATPLAATNSPIHQQSLRTFTSSGGGGGGEGDSDDHHKAQRHRNNKKNTERLGEFKSPIVSQLWSRRSSPAKSIEIDAVNTTAPPVKRPPSLSRTEVVYNFTEDSFLRQSYENPWGFFRKGKLLEDMDAIGANIAFQHCEREGKIPLLVTASIDKIRLSQNPALETDMEMSGQVIWTGSSSMQINMEMRLLPDKSEPWVTACFTFVARSPVTGKATAINPLGPETEEEKRLFQEAEEKNQRRKAMRKQTGASASEIKKGSGKGGKNGSSGQTKFDREAMTQLLLQQARPLLEMPCLSDPTCVLVDSTRLSNCTTMQPQQMNKNGSVFGGFLCRRSFEIAFSTCYLFAGSRPELFEVAHVDFLSPVHIGDLMRFDAAVLYSHMETGSPMVHVQVIASICRPERVESRVSNTFNYVFRVPGKPTVRKVLPSNQDQAKRMVERMEAHYQDE